jgi:hypothetical protein
MEERRTEGYAERRGHLAGHLGGGLSTLRSAHECVRRAE